MATLLDPLRRMALATLQPIHRMRRGMTLGVRAVVRDAEGRVLLVRHSYLPGWTLPGGGVDPGERLEEALARELAEETGAVLQGPPRLHGIFANFKFFPRDHVAVYVVDNWTLPNGFRRSLEIVDHGFFDFAAPPDDTSAGTLRRFAEIGGRAPVSPDW